VQNFPRKCSVACQVSSARQYYKLKACLFWKRYRTLVASPTSSLRCSLDGLNEQVGHLSGFGMPNVQIEFSSVDRKKRLAGEVW
jgi:hypothetical protein